LSKEGSNEDERKIVKIKLRSKMESHAKETSENTEAFLKDYKA
jgi:hypothetical protein